MRLGRWLPFPSAKTATSVVRHASRAARVRGTHQPDGCGSPNTAATDSTSRADVRRWWCSDMRSTCFAAGPPEICMGSSRTSSACDARSLSSSRKRGMRSSEPSRSTWLLVSRCWKSTFRICIVCTCSQRCLFRTSPISSVMTSVQ